MENPADFIQDYIGFISENIKKFESIGDLVRLNEVAADKVFKALANYYNVCISLNTEYQRAKIETLDIEIAYEALYASWFQEAKSVLYHANAEKNAKPALKEIEQQIITSHKLDYFVWKRRLVSAEAKCDFFIRLRETLNKYDGILTGLAASMRSELRALSIENRAESTAQRLGGYVQDSGQCSDDNFSGKGLSGCRLR
jgi:hypothetical protein